MNLLDAEIWELRVTLEGYTFLDDKALLNERRRWWPIGERGGSFWRRWFGVGDPFRFTAGAGEFFLNSARQLIPALWCDEGIFAGHFQIAVASNLGCFDRTAADLLTPRDISSPKGVWYQAREVAPLRFGCLM